MVSAVSTEPAVCTRKDRRDGSRHAIVPSVRVRKEAFGLLFYTTEESRLTFVRSGDLLQIQTLPSGEKTIAAAAKPETQAKIRKLLDHLIKKRLIREP
jgi:putative mycofactocin binding protein MftB